jgi:hypothetical protein
MKMFFTTKGTKDTKDLLRDSARQDRCSVEAKPMAGSNVSLPDDRQTVTTFVIFVLFVVGHSDHVFTG